MITKKQLPDDINKLKEMLIYKQKEIISKDQEIIVKDQEIQLLKETILILQRKKFAPSSEKDNDNNQIFNEVEEFAKDEEIEKETITYERQKQRGKRKSISDLIPRCDEIIDLPEKERIGMKRIGEEITEKLEITPAKVWVRRIIRYKYAPIEQSPNKKIKTAPLPPQLLHKAIASASLIAYIVVSKFVDHLPLYRQSKILKRILVGLSRQTMARWLIEVSIQLTPIYNLLQDELLEAKYLQMDETLSPILKINFLKIFFDY